MNPSDGAHPPSSSSPLPASARGGLSEDQRGSPIPRAAAPASSPTSSSATAVRLALIVEASRVFFESGLDLDAVLDRTSRYLAEQIGDATCVRLLDPDGRMLVTRAVWHRDDAARELLCSVTAAPIDATGPSYHARVVARDRSELVSSMPQADLEHRLGPAFRPWIELFGVHSLLVVPLRAHDRVIGTLALSRDRPGRAYSAGDRELVERLAERAALAIENARLFGAEQTARRETELLMHRVTQLQELTSALSSAVTPAQVATVIADQTVAALGAASAVIFTLSEERHGLQLAGHHGVGAADLDAQRRLDTDAPDPAAVAFRTGEPEFITSRDEYRARYDDDGDEGEPLPGALVALPLLLDARRVGAMLVSFDEPRSFDVETRGFAAMLARQCAQALDRARLYDMERRSREQAALLVEAGTLFATSLDPATTLRTLVRLAVPTLGDVCTVDVVNAGGTLDMLAAAHVDRKQEDAIRILRRQFPVARDDTGHPAAKAIRTGKPQVCYQVGGAGAQAATLNDAQLRLAASLGAQSAVFLPLLARGKVLGVLTLGQVEHRYAPGDVVFLQEFARRAALALDNAALYEAEQRERRAAEEAADRARRLQLVTAALSSAVTPAQVADAVLSEGVDALEAIVGVMTRVTEDGRTLEVVGSRGLAEGVGEAWHRIPIDAPLPLAEAARTGEPVWINQPAEYLARYPTTDSAALSPLGNEAIAALPLRVEGRILGALAFRFAPPRIPTSAERAFITTLANQCSIALERARLYDAERRANRLKDEFLGIVSHELRTPLNAILGWARMLRTGMVKEGAQGRAIATIERNATLQAQLVEDLMDASRIITDKLGLELRRVDLARVVEAAIDSVSPAATAKGVTVHPTIDAHVGAILGDEGRLQQIVWNLLTNAIKFSPKGERVEIALESRAGAAVVTVRDHGEGIAPAFLPHVFERFCQGDATTTRRHGGLGLGLSIVRHLVEAHGGKVRAESDGVGCGSVFTLEIPISTAVELPDEAPSSKAHGATVELSGVRILLVEDELDSREILRQMLTLTGALVEAVGSVAEAMVAFDHARPDVLLSDIGMPIEDGYSLIRRVRARLPERGGRVPAAAITAYATAEDRERALAAGFQLHLSKPVDLEHLSAAIAALIGRAAAQEPVRVAP
jgi:signal transduction histidine kinase/ActR/RegA family two-component response regulator